MNWLKNKVKNHLKVTNCKDVTVHRDYKSNRVVLDYLGGPCVKYNYNGKWIAG